MENWHTITELPPFGLPTLAVLYLPENEYRLVPERRYVVSFYTKENGWYTYDSNSKLIRYSDVGVEVQKWKELLF